jgi:hypothetical protein
MSNTLAAAVDAAMDAEVAYARDRVPDGRGWAMPPRDQVERLAAAALKAASPPAIIKMDAETTPEMVEQLAARWKAVWERDKNKSPVILPPDELEDAPKLRAAAEVLERRMKLAGKRSFLISVWISAMRRTADRMEAKDRAG